MPIVEDVPLTWAGGTNRAPYVTHNVPTSQTPNQLRIDAAREAADAARVYSETTDALVEE